MFLKEKCPHCKSGNLYIQPEFYWLEKKCLQCSRSVDIDNDGKVLDKVLSGVSIERRLLGRPNKMF